MLAHRVLSVCLATLIQTSVFNGGFFLPAVNAMQVIVNEFNNCPHLTGSKMSFENVTLRMDPETKTLFVSGFYNVQRPFDDDITMKIVLKKCTNGAEEHTCTVFFSAEVTKLCKHLPEEGKSWSEFIKHIQKFPTTCPIPVGSYVVDNAPMDVSQIDKMQVVYGFWRMESSGVLADGTVVSCTFSALEITKTKKKKKVLLE